MLFGSTLFRYIALRFLAWCAGVFVAMSTIIFLLDYIEMLRRGAVHPGASFLVLLEMAALQEPLVAQQLMPFAILFATMLLFWRMTRANELVVARSAGVSAWQFLAPALVAACLIGVFAIMVFNPVAAVLQARLEAMESRVLHAGTNSLTFSSNGFWLRQSNRAGEAAVIHADGMRMPETRLRDVTILTFDHGTRLTGRIDAKSAVLKGDHWLIDDGARWSPGQAPVPFAHSSLWTNLTPTKIQEGFAAPETMSFWQLPGFIGLLQRSGFSAQRHILYFDALLARPLLFPAMVLIAAIFSLRGHRRGGVALMLGFGVGCAFAFYFFSDVVFALGLAAAIPVVLAAWIPTGVSWLLGASLVFHLEDG
jgi:lipopolysaccharide export system permease protein